MKVAIIHDWLTGMRGAEKGLEILCELYPDATMFTLIYNKPVMSDTINNMEVKTSFLQKFPSIFSKYRYYLPFYRRAIESFDLSGYDLVISHSHCVAKCVKTPPGALHICYCYTPMRYAWVFFDQYFGNYNLFFQSIIKWVTKRLRIWDKRVSDRVDYFIACSKYIGERIEHCYDRKSDVIYPPVEVKDFVPNNLPSEDFYLVVSAMVPYKKNKLSVEAFNKLGKHLVVIGEGPCLEEMKSLAKSNITFLGWGDKNLLKEYYPRCKALLFPGEEDFGIIPVEVQACGRPVIAYRKGGATETVLEDTTGVFFDDQTIVSVCDAVNRFESMEFDPKVIREHALTFDRELFRDKMSSYILEKYKGHSEKILEN